MVSVSCLSMRRGKNIDAPRSLVGDDFHEISKIVRIAHPAPDLGPRGRIFRQIRVLTHPVAGLE